MRERGIFGANFEFRKNVWLLGRMQRSKKKLCPRDRPESVQKYDSADTLSFILLVMDGGTQKVDFG